MEMLMKLLMARKNKGSDPIPPAQPPILPSGEPGTTNSQAMPAPLTSTPSTAGLTPEQQAQMERLRRQNLSGMNRAQQAYADYTNPNMSNTQATINLFDRGGRYSGLFKMFE
jgi:hypothetical protein